MPPLPRALRSAASPRLLRGSGPVLGLAVALALGSCGASPPVRFPGSKLALRIDEYRILPQTASMKPGRIKIVAQDTGVLTHNVRVQSFRPDSTGTPTIYAATPTAHPGQTVTAKVRLRRGRYKLICSLGNHADLGQIATLVVE